MSALFLSFGPSSGFLTGQVINNIIECVDIPPTWYSERARCLIPNAVFFDSAKSVHLYEDPQIPDVSELPHKIERLDPGPDSSIRIPRFRPTPFIEYVKAGGQTLIPLDQPRPNFRLESCDLVWSDIANFNLSRKLFYEIPGSDIEPLLTFSSGFERASDPEIYDGLTEPIRRSLETIDRIGCLSVGIDRNFGFGGVYAKVAEYLAEETPKATQYSFSMAEEITSEEVACNASFSLSAALQFSSLHAVLTLPPTAPNIIDASLFHPASLYERASLFGLPVTSALLPILAGTVTAREVVDVVAPTSILKFASLSSAFPFYDALVDFSFRAEERIFSRFSALNGVPTDVGAKLIDQTLKPESPFFYRGTMQRNPCFIGLTMPHFFKSNVITNTGDRPTGRPAGLSDDMFQKLVQYKVTKHRPPVECASIRTLSTIATFSTSRSLIEPLRNTAEFFRNAPRITRTIAHDDAQAAAEVVLNICNGLAADQ
jgi:hypothetical protein